MAKARLFGMQVPADDAVIATDDRLTCDIAEKIVAHLVPVSGKRVLEEGVSVVDGVARIDGAEVGAQAAWPALQGPHNAQNAAAAIAACRALDVATADIVAALATYPGLPHRMERVAEKHGVLYVNDSKATNPDSAAPALAAYPSVHWIAGGLAKADQLDACAGNLGHVRSAYLIGTAAPLFGRLLDGIVPVVQAETLDRAVTLAAAAAQPGDTVLLSPACASYDQFTDYEARGAAFRAAVERLA